MIYLWYTKINSFSKYSFSFFLFSELWTKYPFILRLLSLIFSNLYYISYANTVLTESLFFSAVNFLAGLMILNKNRSNLLLIFLSLILGIICSLKSIGPVISIITLVYICLVKKPKLNIKNIISLFFPLLAVIIL